MPVTASLTDALAAEAVPSDGRVGLAFVHAVALASSASALQIAKCFSFMCSYRGLEILNNAKKSPRQRLGNPSAAVRELEDTVFETSSSSTIRRVHAEIQLP